MPEDNQTPVAPPPSLDQVVRAPDCYIGRLPCGCAVAWVKMSEEHKREVSKSVSEFIKLGYTVEPAVTDDVRSELGPCKHNTAIRDTCQCGRQKPATWECCAWCVHEKPMGERPSPETTPWLEQNTKQCTICRRMLLLSDFSKYHGKETLRPNCKWCARECSRRSRERAALRPNADISDRR